ncbi:MAG: OmpA family protein [Myxococcota bacterium]
MLLPLMMSAMAFAVDLDPFEPSGSLATGTGTVESEAAHLGADGPVIGLTGMVIRDPYVLLFQDGRETSAFALAVPMNLQLGWTINQRARLDVHLPFYAHTDIPVLDRSGPALGDMRVATVVEIWQPTPLFALSAHAELGLPTGTRASYLSRGVYGQVQLLLGGASERVGPGWSLNLGGTFDGGGTLSGVQLGSTIDAVGGFWWRFDDVFRLGGDVAAHVGLPGPETFGNTILSTHVFAAATLPTGLGLTAGLGTSPIPGVGAPTWRVFAQASWAFAGRDKDVDDAPETPDDPPELPDGVMDTDDDPEVDRDGDGLPDDGDACPDQPAPDDASGCPDSDSDGLRDHVDACPMQPRPPDERLDTADGCPREVWITATHVRWSAPLGFEGQTTTLTTDSTTTLDALARVLNGTPNLNVQIEVHTDNALERADGIRRTQAQADLVLEALTTRYVSASRLKAVGFGPDQPVDTNRTEAGRAANRRVVLKVLE